METKALTPADKKHWLRLIRTRNIGPITFHQLIRRFGSAEEALKQIPSYAKASGGRKNFTLASIESVEAELDLGAKLDAALLCSCEPSYSTALSHIPDPPPALWVKGDTALLHQNTVAIVGARNASSVGCHMAHNLARDLGRAGYAIASGLARGIDGAAHKASLSTGTLAAVAGGIDIIYPPEHEALTEQIAQQGLLLSEMPLSYRPTGRDFPKRNRIISGLSLGVVVVEAATKSGTLITARMAGEQGREIFAVPGSPMDPRCQGTNRLLREGAILVETADDVIDALRADTQKLREPAQGSLFDGPVPAFTASERHRTCEQILQLLSFTPVHRDLLLRDIDAPTPLVLDALLDLVLESKVEESTGGMYALAAL